MTDRTNKNEPWCEDHSHADTPIYPENDEPTPTTVQRGSKREEAEDYRHVVKGSDTWRVILCKGRLQWILQMRTGKRWRAESYNRNRDALLRMMQEKDADPDLIAECKRLPLWVEWYVDPNADDPNHSTALKLNLGLDCRFDDLVKRMGRRVLGTPEKLPRKDVLTGTENALRVILANLLNWHLLDRKRYVAVTRGNGTYRRTAPNNPFGLSDSDVQRTMQFLERHQPGYLEKRGGNRGDSKKKGHSTRIRARQRLINEIGKFAGIRGVDISARLRLLSRDSLIEQRQADPIRIKNKNGHYVSCKDDEIRRMRSRLNFYNRFLDKHCIDLMIPDAEFSALQHRSKRNPNPYFEERDKRRIELDLLFHRRLYRSFNRSSLSYGGRFYGGWWQNLPGEYRKYITINGHPTVELDYEAMVVNMLHAKEGCSPPEKSYSLDGFPDEHRDLLKGAFFRIINATNGMAQPKQMPSGWTWNDILDGLKDLHAPIAKYFGSGIGLELQRIDADIAEIVMLKMLGLGYLALPVHDSFIVKFDAEDTLRQVMLDVYRNKLKQSIGVETGDSWLDDQIRAGALKRDNLSARHVEELVSNHVNQRGYEQYRKRQANYKRS